VGTTTTRNNIRGNNNEARARARRFNPRSSRPASSLASSSSSCEAAETEDGGEIRRRRPSRAENSRGRRNAGAMGVAKSEVRVGETTLDEYLAAAIGETSDAKRREMFEEDARALRALSRACVRIHEVVRRAGLSDVASMTEGKNGVVNVHGEEQAALDDAAHEMCVEELEACGACRWIASEESEDVVPASSRGAVAVVFDPLDGSSNIECGVGVGTIFGIVGVDEDSTAESVYARPGSDMRSAGYVLYGSSTILVLSLVDGDALGGVCAFTLDETRGDGEFVLTKLNVRIPEKGKVYSVNQGNADKWSPGVAAYVSEASAEQSLRYIGSMVADVHRTLLYGGTFHYPADSKNINGKLRAVYECFPMSAVIERAGGLSISGESERVLDFVPETAHSRVPIHLGSAKDIERLSQVLAEHRIADRNAYGPR